MMVRTRSLSIENLEEKEFLSTTRAISTLESDKAAEVKFDIGPVAEATAVGNEAVARNVFTGLFAQDRRISVNKEDRIVAYYDMGGTPLADCSHRNLSLGLATTGWETVLTLYYQPVVDAGLRRFLVATPFGQRSLVPHPTTGACVRAPNEFGFQFDAYLDAQVQVPNKNATRDFIPAWQQFISHNRAAGVELDVIMYIGSPRLDPDMEALVPTPDAWWERAYDIILPLLRAGVRSIGFDGSAPVSPDMLDYQLHDVLRFPELRDPVRDARLINVIGNQPITVYLEAVPHEVSERTDYPLALLNRDFIRQDTNLPGTDHLIPHEALTAEVIRIVRHEEWQANGVLPIEDILADGHSASVTYAFLTRPQLNGGADTLDEFADLLFVPTMPTLIDLDPDDRNADTVRYEIVTSPRFGTLTPNSFHDDAFTYTPNPGFSGEDIIRYKVVDPATGDMATGTIRLFVNVPVEAEPEEEGRAGRSGKRRAGARPRLR